MLDEMGLNIPAVPEMATIRYLVDCGNAEYGLEGSVEKFLSISGL